MTNNKIDFNFLYLTLRNNSKVWGFMLTHYMAIKQLTVRLSFCIEKENLPEKRLGWMTD